MENGRVEHSGVCSSETANGGEDVYSCKPSDASSADHLVIMVHGILGSSSDWKFGAEQFVRSLPDKVFVHCSERNMAKLTLDGVDVMGERLSEEVLEVIKRKPNLLKISFVAHSVGGVVARYAIGRLYRPPLSENEGELSTNGGEEEAKATIAGLEPINFITVATPHLGSRGNKQVPFLFGVTALEKAAGRVVHWIFGRTGRHLFLTDDDEGKPPLLRRMVEDYGDCPFMSALRSFKRRVAYSNVGYDHIVGWRTSSIRRNNELPKWEDSLNEKYPHVVYEEHCKASDVQQIDSVAANNKDLDEIEVSGLSGTKEEAQSQVSVGIGLLAGSTVMLLTVIWGSCVIVGKCDIENSVATDKKDTKGFSLTGSGVSTDVWTCYAAIIMAVSVIPFIIVQFPQVLHSKSGRHLAVLIALIVSVSLMISYCLYQVFQPWVQRRRLAFAKHKHVISGILKNLKMRALGRLCDDDGRPNEEVLRALFNTIDENRDGYLSHSELRALVIGIRFEEINLEEQDALSKVMKDFDTSLDARISFAEFHNGIARWLEEARGSRAPSREAGPGTMKYLDDYHEQTKREHYLLGDQSEQSDEVVEGVENPRSTTIKAVLLLLLGAGIAAAFADPLVDAVNNFSSATSIPSFFISFIALPLATNSSEAVSAIIFAKGKKLRSASLTFSELYGAVTMNNVLCLSVFLALVYVRGLIWDFSSEVLVILIVCIVLGVLGSMRTTFPLWTSLIAFLLYPFSLALVYVLDYVFGWT